MRAKPEQNKTLSLPDCGSQEFNNLLTRAGLCESHRVMASVFLYEDFKDFLRDELERRTLKNSKYSLRAFARDLDVSLSRLSEVFAKGEGISMTSALKIAAKLKMSESEKEYFQQIILAHHGRNKVIREKALTRVRGNKAKRELTFLRESHLGVLSQWYYLALAEMLTLKNAPTSEELAKILGLNLSSIEAATAHLADKGFIVRSKSGRWVKSSPFIHVESSTPAESIRRYHQKLIARGLGAIDSQPIADRKYLTTVFSVKKESIEEARRELERFNNEFLHKYTSPTEADSVYCFALQLFQFDERKTK